MCGWTKRLSEKERESLFAAWEKDGVKVSRHPFLPYAVELQGAAGIGSLAGYAEGRFAVQDVSSIAGGGGGGHLPRGYGD